MTLERDAQRALGGGLFGFVRRYVLGSQDRFTSGYARRRAESLASGRQRDAAEAGYVIDRLRSAGVLPARSGLYTATRLTEPWGQTHTVNHLVAESAHPWYREPCYFVKESRYPEADTLKQEADALRLLEQRQTESRRGGGVLGGAVPRLVYHGVAGERIGVFRREILVMTYLDYPRPRRSGWAYLRRLDKLGFAGRISEWANRQWLKEIDPLMRAALTWLAEFHHMTGMVHGDFDLCNILGTPGRLAVVDFEQATPTGEPLFDVGNIMFSPLILQWRGSGQREYLQDYARRTGWMPYLRVWASTYARAGGTDANLECLPAIAVQAQHAIIYPVWRNPLTMPLYGQDVLDDVQGWKLW